METGLGKPSSGGTLIEENLLMKASGRVMMAYKKGCRNRM